MLTLEFRHGSRTPVRFAKSPLWETVAFARLVAKREGERTRDTVKVREIPLLDALLARELPYTPDFLAPPPLQTEETFEEEVRRLRAISPDVVASSCHGCSVAFDARPSRLLSCDIAPVLAACSPRSRRS